MTDYSRLVDKGIFELSPPELMSAFPRARTHSTEISGSSSVSQVSRHINDTAIMGDFYLGIDERIYSLESQLKNLYGLIATLTEEFHQFRLEQEQKPVVYSLQIFDVMNADLLVKNPISVVVDETEDEALVRWPETRAYGLGDTLSEAMIALKTHIVEMYSSLKGREASDLGVIAIRTLDVLDQYLTRKN